ncbi:MAG: PIN domain-containing protein [Armatimonadetes bacterium]|nr:PIN domain-containing protein [Armatimonadota bacterium]
MKLATVDASVLVSILMGESGWEALEAILLGIQPMISSATILETFLVLRPRLGDSAQELIDRALADYGFTVTDFSLRHLAIAQTAFEKYGKGRHPAKLNFGDCIVYATAKLSDTPLLFVGDDFAKTDLEVVRIPEA